MTISQLSGGGGAPAASGSSFYTAMRILPPAKREGMFAVYAFCRAVDDIADGGDPKPERIADLDAWRRDLDRLYQSGDETCLTRGLRTPIESFSLRLSDFAAVIDGMEMDVRRDHEPPDWQALDLYCDRVASAVGRLSVKIFDVEEAKGLELSSHLGRALQLTNILRDIDEDAAMGRLYLPAEALRHAGIRTEGVAETLAHPSLDAACRVVAERARGHFREANSVMARCPRETVRSPRVMASYYRSIFDRLLARGWTAPRRAVRYSKPRVLWAVIHYGLL